jgi:hypothetical protein
MRQYTGRNRDKCHSFGEECSENKRTLRRALRDFKAKNDEESRIKYWVCRKRYAKILEHRRKVWQAKEVERINTVVRQKNNKKVWEKIRSTVKKRDFVYEVKPDEWVKHFDELFSSDTNRGISYETQKLGPPYIEEFDRDFKKDEVTQRI